MCGEFNRGENGSRKNPLKSKNQRFFVPPTASLLLLLTNRLTWHLVRKLQGHVTNIKRNKKIRKKKRKKRNSLVCVHFASMMDNDKVWRFSLNGTQRQLTRQGRK